MGVAELLETCKKISIAIPVRVKSRNYSAREVARSARANMVISIQAESLRSRIDR